MNSQTVGSDIRQRRLALGISTYFLAGKAGLNQPNLSVLELHGYGVGPEGINRLRVVLTSLEHEKTVSTLNVKRTEALSDIGRSYAPALRGGKQMKIKTFRDAVVRARENRESVGAIVATAREDLALLVRDATAFGRKRSDGHDIAHLVNSSVVANWSKKERVGLARALVALFEADFGLARIDLEKAVRELEAKELLALIVSDVDARGGGKDKTNGARCLAT